MLDDLPTAIGTKKNSKGYKTIWAGYKLHIGGYGQIPISWCAVRRRHSSAGAIPPGNCRSSR